MDSVADVFIHAPVAVLQELPADPREAFAARSRGDVQRALADGGRVDQGSPWCRRVGVSVCRRYSLAVNLSIGWRIHSGLVLVLEPELVTRAFLFPLNRRKQRKRRISAPLCYLCYLLLKRWGAARTGL